jgi:hypothetical protein
VNVARVLLCLTTVVSLAAASRTEEALSDADSQRISHYIVEVEVPWLDQPIRLAHWVPTNRLILYDGYEAGKSVVADGSMQRARLTMQIFLGSKIWAGSTTHQLEPYQSQSVWMLQGATLYEFALNWTPEVAGPHISTSVATTTPHYLLTRLQAVLGTQQGLGMFLLRSPAPESEAVSLAELEEVSGTSDWSAETDHSEDGTLHSLHVAFDYRDPSTDPAGTRHIYQEATLSEFAPSPSFRGSVSEAVVIPHLMQASGRYEVWKEGTHGVQRTGRVHEVELRLQEVRPMTDEEALAHFTRHLPDGSPIHAWRDDPVEDGLTREWRDGAVRVVYDEAAARRVEESVATLPPATGARLGTLAGLGGLMIVSLAAAGGMVYLAVRRSRGTDASAKEAA